MKHITILIPTRNRLEKLKKTLASIPNLSYVDVIVICDNDEVTWQYINKYYFSGIQVRILFTDSWKHPTFSGSVKCKNSFMEEVKDGLLYATDDIIFQEGAIQSTF